MLATAGLSLVLYVTGLFVPLTPLPFALNGVRRGCAKAAISLGLSLLILFLLYQGPESLHPFLPAGSLAGHLGSLQASLLGLLLFFYYGWIGVLLANASSRRHGLERSVLEILVPALLVPALLLFGGAKYFGFSLVTEIRGGLEWTMERMAALQEKSGLEGEEVLFLKTQASAIVSQIMGLLPSAAVNLTLFLIALNAGFLKRWSLEAKPFPGWVDFPLWRLREKWIWIPILSGSLFFLNHYFFHERLLGVVALNFLVLAAGVYFFQGLAIAFFFFQKRLPPITRLFAYLLMFLFLQVMGVVIVLVGLFDFWFDFRRLKRVA